MGLVDKILILRYAVEACVKQINHGSLMASVTLSRGVYFGAIEVIERKLAHEVIAWGNQVQSLWKTAVESQEFLARSGPFVGENFEKMAIFCHHVTMQSQCMASLKERADKLLEQIESCPITVPRPLLKRIQILKKSTEFLHAITLDELNIIRNSDV